MAAILALTQIKLGTNPTTPANNFVVQGDGTGAFIIGAGNPSSFVERSRLTSLGNQVITQGPESPQNSNATLSVAQLQSQIVTSTGATLTLPTGTALEGYTANMAVNTAFEVVVIATTSGVVTLASNTGLTVVGALTVAGNTSGRFRFRKTALNTFTVYRV